MEEETNEEAKEKEAKDEGEVQIRRPLSWLSFERVEDLDNPAHQPQQSIWHISAIAKFKWRISVEKVALNQGPLFQKNKKQKFQFAQA